MKLIKSNYKIFLIPVFGIFHNWLIAQVSIEIKANNICQSIFCQSKYSKKYIINDTLDVFAMMNFSCIEIKFPGRNWMPSCYPLQDSDDGVYISTYESGGYVNLLPTFLSDTTLLSEFGNTGALIELRYRLNAKVEDGYFLMFYSNIDTISLPPATPDDIAAIAFLRSSGIPIDKFAWLIQISDDYQDSLKNMESQFPNSVISEISKYFAIQNEMILKYFANNEIWSTEIKSESKIDFSTLLESKSDIVRDKAKFQVEIGVDGKQ